jgi:hypothetical protein
VLGLVGKRKRLLGNAAADAIFGFLLVVSQGSEISRTKRSRIDILTCRFFAICDRPGYSFSFFYSFLLSYIVITHYLRMKKSIPNI